MPPILDFSLFFSRIDVYIYTSFSHVPLCGSIANLPILVFAISFLSLFVLQYLLVFTRSFHMHYSSLLTATHNHSVEEEGSYPTSDARKLPIKK